jgi:hypothetical protein
MNTNIKPLCLHLSAGGTAGCRFPTNQRRNPKISQPNKTLSSLLSACIRRFLINLQRKSKHLTGDETTEIKSTRFGDISDILKSNPAGGFPK